MNRIALFVLLLGGLVRVGFGQQAPGMSTATCSFDDGRQVSVRYESEKNGDKKELPRGKVWMPGGQPMWLFAQAELSVGSSQIPIGAYSMYIIPNKQDWTLIINKNVSAHSTYNQQEDVARVKMELGQLTAPEKELGVFFGHVAPKQCNIRIYYGKSGAWAEFKEK